MNDDGPEFTPGPSSSGGTSRGLVRHLISNGRFRDECVNENWFTGLAVGRQVARGWLRDDNHYKPHRTLGGFPPEEFASRWVELRSPPPSPATPPQPIWIPHNYRANHGGCQTLSFRFAIFIWIPLTARPARK
ncbi:integrase core domain-containing protein [Geothrix oryzae]|uniref:integrase core domain-containing protein n=1 Tax=Geothrix oryzae TaxID=2927975 RepID=UPI0035CBD21C